MNTAATFSFCRRYRYTLDRRWAPLAPDLAVVGLNPSTADETVDDPTIRRLVGFAQRWGYGGIVMLNLFALRATDPKEMLAERDPVGPDNDVVILRETDSRHVLCAWGTHGKHRARGFAVEMMLRDDGRSLFHLGMTKGGQPKHPLYLPSATRLQPWEARW